jgi:hypothetical protein
MAGSRVHWLGDKVRDGIAAAARKGIDETMAECVTQAQTVAPRRTGAMASNIKIVSRAKAMGKRTSGFWGNDTQDYTIWVEVGSRGRPGRYFLRGAADLHYKNLPARIRAWAKLGR